MSSNDRLNSSLAYVASILGFDVVEMWRIGDDNSMSLKCKYIADHVLDNQTIAISTSTALCQQAIQDSANVVWRIQESIPCTEIAILLGQTKMQFILVAYSINARVLRSESKLKFVQAFDQPMAIAAFEMKEEIILESEFSSEVMGSTAELQEDLDELNPFLSSEQPPVTTAYDSGSVWVRGAPLMDDDVTVEGPCIHPVSSVSSDDTADDSHVSAALGLGGNDGFGQDGFVRKPFYPKDLLPKPMAPSFSNADFPPNSARKVDEDSDGVLTLFSKTTSRSIMSKVSDEGIATTPESTHSAPKKILKKLVKLAPFWEPTHPFSFPIAQVSVKNRIRDDLKMTDFENVEHLEDGGHSTIYTAIFPGKGRVIIKMIHESVQDSASVNREFNVEHGFLARVSHPNIIRILGAGCDPRRFLVLEYLEGGTLLTIMAKRLTGGFASNFFRKATFTYQQVLSKARELASALMYLHEECQLGATIIHRDLKPDNIGFASDGTLKLFDFGLSTIIMRRGASGQVFKMTGNTGSLRYMAPEVALSDPYTEKVDVYSFGIIVWQMMKDKLPFQDLDEKAFIERVVTQHHRPNLDKTWPQPFNQLLLKCWAPRFVERPSFPAVIEHLDAIIAESLMKPRAGLTFGFTTGSGTTMKSP